MATVRLTNVRPWGGAAADMVMAGARILDVVPAGTAANDGETTIDGGGRLALPGLLNVHAHVDKSWWGRPWVAAGGAPGTAGRIAHERAERDALGIPSVESATAVLRELVRHGTTGVRTHVDVDLGVGLRGIDVVRTAAAALGDAVQVDVVAFPQDGVMRRPGVLDLLDQAAAAGATHVGGIDPASIDRDPVRQLDGLFDIAERRGVGIDIHLHDGGELGAFQLELIAERTRGAGLHGRVTISHGFALGELPPGRQTELLDVLAEAGIGWATAAPVRSTPLPWREMRERGIPIGLGTDGIRDLWSPFGDGDLLRIALGFARLHALRADDDLVDVVRLATSHAGGYLGRAAHDLAPGSRADVVLLEAENVQDALVRCPPRALVVAGGQVVQRAGDVLI
ncbi:amidohydrolase family protein [Jiangella muralis]|uniref:amidohydrolase family protein n=1 Tax=Jiangella muralis TaxID=702383 RepID=UPI00069D46D6|nr:amidohydrolase family protein [Jiangella muralis]